MFLRFSYDEMLCMSEAIESGQDFCPSPMIIEQLDACLKESEEGKLQAPSESDLPPGAVVCRLFPYIFSENQVRQNNSDFQNSRDV